MESQSVPQCLGFIMDGNRRWATEHGLPTLEGHTRGYAVFTDCVAFVRDAGVPHAVFYAFSTENWQRSEVEVTYLMQLCAQMLRELTEKISENNVRIKFIGNRSDFSSEIQDLMQAVEAASAHFTGTTVWVALSYGGRAEILAAVNQAIELKVPVDEATFAALLWSADMPDPDMIVRTSGEQRLSNFMTWKSVYSELYFVDKHWPALTTADFNDILEEYGRRNRRQGA